MTILKNYLTPVEGNNTTEQFRPSYPNHVERNILEEEVRNAVRTSPKNKAAGEDGIITQAIVACGETGIKWLTSIFLKIFAKILEQRTRAIVEPQLSEAQFGFSKGRGCTDAIFALRQLCERVYEYKKHLHMVFVDQEKAFDRLNRNRLWEVLEVRIEGQLLDNIRTIYLNSQSSLRTSKGLTNWCNVTL
ncbi:uncharacterized protein LOC144916732 [Branchiostoma floridae x Branchiostoma belcheri]